MGEVLLKLADPLAGDPSSYFTDTPDEAAAMGLLALMTGLSEELWCAGWISGLEHSLWHARERGSAPFGMGEITQRQCDLLRLLSDEADGWWVWDDGAHFVFLDDWRSHLRALAQKSADHG